VLSLFIACQPHCRAISVHATKNKRKIMKNNTDFKDLIRIEISKTKVIAIFVASLLFYMAAVVLWKQNAFDNNIVMHFNYVYENEMHLKFIKMLSHFGMSFITAVYALFLFLSFRKEELKNDRPLLFLILISFAFGGIGGDLIKEIIDKARPVITLSEQIAIKNINDTPSFPSGHATKSMALALPFLLLASRKNIITIIVKILVFTAALLVCYSRIALQAHFLSDVLAGIGTALFFIPFSILFVNFRCRRNKVNMEKFDLMSRRIILLFIGLTIILYLIS
jgi:membrane-associated phospholipid phosphatase